MGLERKVVYGAKGWLGLWAILTVALLWPLFLIGAPGYTPDTSSYYRGGQAAVQFGIDQVAKIVQRTKERNLEPSLHPTTREPAQPIGIRSITYSILVYLLAFPGTSLVGLIVVQSAITAGVIALFCRAIGLTDSWLAAVVVIAGLSAGTALPTFTTLAMPDIFSGVLILGVLVLSAFAGQLTAIERVCVAAVVALAVASHASHILLAIGMLLVFFVYASVTALRRMTRGIKWDLRWPAAALAAGLVGSVITSVIGFGEVTAIPKRYPFALARSIQDGPARWYLEQHCAIDKYAICELFPDRIPADFLWGPGGIAQRATPEQMERIRAEETTIVRLATAEHPGAQFRSSARNLWEQIRFVSLDPLSYRGTRLAGSGELVVDRPSPSLEWHKQVQVGVLVLAVLVISLGSWSATTRVKWAIVNIAAAILGNAVICGVLSAPDSRYQSRLLWLMPLLAVYVFWDLRISRSSALALRG